MRKKSKKISVVAKKNTAKKISVKEYAQTLSEIKKLVIEAQQRAASAVNKELSFLYWLIGKTIVERQEKSGWGENVLENLAEDLQNAFPGMAGFSRSNVYRMKAFFLAYQENPTAVGQIDNLSIFKIPWGHNAVILERIKDEKLRLWYAQKVLDLGWSRSTLETSIKSNLYKREGKAISNFQKTLPNPHAGAVQQSLKDPCLFDFLTLSNDHIERDVEQGLIDHIQKFLLELGQGFSFVGRQVHFEVSGKDYYVDLLFYHFKLKCFIVVELKAREFDPRDAGQINFYLSAVDDRLRSVGDQPTIGLIICKNKDDLTVEYALRRSSSPIGVARYEAQIVESLPKNLKSKLPTIEEIELGLEKQEVLAQNEKIKKIRMKKARKK